MSEPLNRKLTCREYGSLRGVVELRRGNLVLTDCLTDEETGCHCDRSVGRELRKNLGRRVEISGKIVTNRESGKKIIHVKQVRVLRERKIASVKGNPRNGSRARG